MRHTGLKKIFYFLAALLIFITNVQAQQPPADTTQKQINIIHANKITFKKIDSLNDNLADDLKSLDIIKRNLIKNDN